MLILVADEGATAAAAAAVAVAVAVVLEMVCSALPRVVNSHCFWIARSNIDMKFMAKLFAGTLFLCP